MLFIIDRAKLICKKEVTSLRNQSQNVTLQDLNFPFNYLTLVISCV